MRAFPAMLLAVNMSAAVISGVVVDEEGKPIEGARVDHMGKPVVIGPPSVPAGPDETRTDANGAFRVTATVSAFVIRKPGFQSQRIPITGDAQLKITLRPIGPIPKCPVEIPPIKTKQANDSDYQAIWTYIETKDGAKGIISGHGPLYSWGAPDDSNVWTSTDYFEVMYKDGVVDARGHVETGYWRLQGAFGAASQYYRMERSTAEILDCIMDRNPLRSPR